MDGTSFDWWVRSITQHASRRGVLRSAFAALAGVTLAWEPGEAKKKKVKVCNCQNEFATSCNTQKKAKKKVKKLLRNNPCAYRGRCTGVSGCPEGRTPPGGKPPGTLCDTSSECASPFTCALPLNDSGGDKRCCGASGAPCGGDNIDLDDLPPICCQGFICSTDGQGTSTPGTCQPVP